MEFKLKAEKREANEKLSAEYIPAVVYGKGILAVIVNQNQPPYQ